MLDRTQDCNMYFYNQELVNRTNKYNSEYFNLNSTKLWADLQPLPATALIGTLIKKNE